jgi:hypothetical protein
MPRQIMGEREIQVTEIERNLSLRTRGGIRGGTRKGSPRDFTVACVDKYAELL